VEIIKGDLIKLAKSGYFDVIVHGCNCFCVMGAGIAKQIKKEFLEAYVADCNTKSGDPTKLGTFSCAIKNGVTVINAYIQFNYSRKSVNVDYNALRAVMNKIKKSFSGFKIGYPKIGAGLAGGDWNIISKIIDEELEGEDHTLVEYANEF